MLRAYCDRCGAELGDGENRVSRRVKRELDDVSVEVIVAVKGTWNGGHVCTTCVVQTVHEGADR